MTMSVRGAIAATLLAGTALAATPAFADEADAPGPITISGDVTLVTDYRFRGVSLSGGDPAIQGGITVTHETGVYAGAWSSSIQGGGAYGEQELDLFGGWSGEVTSGLTLDVGLLYYDYPGADKHTPLGAKNHVNYWEPYASLSGDIGPASLKVGVAYAWDQKSLGSEDNLYLYSDVDVAVPNTPVTVSGHIGYTDGVLAPEYLNGLSDQTGWDWSIGASATVYGPLSVGVSYIGVTGPSVDGFTDDTVVATVSASF
ncbi:TorF family putative porin [Novosphingobium beihaiensis]|uniref:TorF family putative porin n=1 Tax=Novosphingobium beihaiensis TaxID=2930389 RepID=A0ABT0BSJ2_9SPHN|nr:TorF family putative porin [Novosphingobium beihaiensis]MCJ2187943.1 TorF family putative porin [Novosphingobium beihaiensis]